MKFGDGKHIKRLNAYEKEKVDINMTNTVILNNFKAFFEDLKKNYKYSRLGKTFATTNNFYFYDTGTGKVLSVTLSIYKILECLLETDTFDSIFQLGIANEELYASLLEIKEAVQNENILQAPPVLTITEGGEYASDCLLPEHSRKRGTGVIRGERLWFLPEICGNVGGKHSAFGRETACPKCSCNGCHNCNGKWGTEIYTQFQHRGYRALPCHEQQINRIPEEAGFSETICRHPCS